MVVMHSSAIEFGRLEIVGDILVPLFFGIALAVAVTRYLNFTQLIQRVAVLNQRLYLLYREDDPKAAKRTLHEINLEVSAVILTLRCEGHIRASDELNAIWDQYEGLFARAVATIFTEGRPEHSRVWFKETVTNFAARALKLRPDWLRLFLLQPFYAAVAVTRDQELKDWKSPTPQPPQKMV